MRKWGIRTRSRLVTRWHVYQIQPVLGTIICHWGFDTKEEADDYESYISKLAPNFHYEIHEVEVWKLY